MTAVITQIISGIVRCAAAVAEHLNLPEVRRKGAAKAEKAEAAEKAAAEADVSRAVYSGDRDAVNQTLGKVLGFALAVGLSAVCGCVCCSCGRTVTRYVPADRAVIPMTCTNGVTGWFVPDATFDDLLKAAQRAKDLERQQAVTARMEGTR